MDVIEYAEMPVGSIIDRPGAFEGEPRYVPFYWNLSGDGCFDEQYWIADRLYTVFLINEDDIEEWHELVDVYALELSSDDSGFIWSDELSEEEFKKIGNAHGWLF